MSKFDEMVRAVENNQAATASNGDALMRIPKPLLEKVAQALEAPTGTVQFNPAGKIPPDDGTFSLDVIVMIPSKNAVDVSVRVDLLNQNGRVRISADGEEVSNIFINTMNASTLDTAAGAIAEKLHNKALSAK